MSSSDPIRPVNGVSSDPLSVRRAELLARVDRQRHGDADDEARDRRNREDRHHDALEEQRSRIWITRTDADPATEAGAYDDHGRTGNAAHTQPMRHIDASI